MNLKDRISLELYKANIRINGGQPYDPHIFNDRVFNRVAIHGTLGLGESFADGDWDCEDLSGFLARCILAGLDQHHKGLEGIAYRVWSKMFNDQTPRRAERVADHYNKSNELYQLMLGRDMIYTSARLSDGAETLDEAQRDKIRWFCKQLGIQPGHRVLDIGCGWGGFAKIVAEEFSAAVVGVTIAEKQLFVAQAKCKDLPCDFHLMDWRRMRRKFSPEAFDHIVSIEMIEAVGQKNLREFMEDVAHLLRRGGKFGLQAITGNHPGSDAFYNRYIFPGGYIPSFAELAKSTDGIFTFEVLENLGDDYAWTLREWRKNLLAHWDELQSMDPSVYTEWFKRIMIYYLSSCEATFLTRVNHSSQMILSRQKR